MSDKTSNISMNDNMPRPLERETVKAIDTHKADKLRKQQEDSLFNEPKKICHQDNPVSPTVGMINLEGVSVVEVEMDEEALVAIRNEEMDTNEGTQVSEQTVQQEESLPTIIAGPDQVFELSNEFDLMKEVFNLKKENQVLKDKQEQQQKILEQMQLQMEKFQGWFSGQASGKTHNVKDNTTDNVSLEDCQGKV